MSIQRERLPMNSVRSAEETLSPQGYTITNLLKSAFGKIEETISNLSRSRQSLCSPNQLGLIESEPVVANSSWAPVPCWNFVSVADRH